MGDPCPGSFYQAGACPIPAELKQARADFALARALRAGEREPQRARELAELALRRYRDAGEPYAEARLTVERWLAEQTW